MRIFNRKLIRVKKEEYVQAQFLGIWPQNILGPPTEGYFYRQPLHTCVTLLPL